MAEKGTLIAFLNAVLDVDDGNKLISLEIINNKELFKELIFDKTSRLDVKLKQQTVCRTILKSNLRIKIT